MSKINDVNESEGPLSQADDEEGKEYCNITPFIC